MPSQNTDELIRQANNDFELSHDYENPFVKFGDTKAPLDDTQLLRAAQDPAPFPVDAQTKPDSSEAKDESESEGDEEEEDDSEQDENEDGRRVSGSHVEKEKELKAVKATILPVVPKSERQPPTKVSTVASSAGPAVPKPPAKTVTSSSASESKPNEPSRSVSDKQTGKKDASAGERTAVSDSKVTRPSRQDHARRSSDLSPFTLISPRLTSVTVKPGSNASGVRSGGVTSPPPSDTASIAGVRLDEEDPLDAGLDDPEDLMDFVSLNAKVLRPTDKRPSTSKPANKASNSKKKGGKAVLSSGSPAVVESELASNHELRIAALEKLVSSLLEANKVLSTKTDALIRELNNTRTELVMEINEKSKRVGGPAPSLTVTAPSPVDGPGEVALPSNVVPTDPNRGKSTASSVPAGLSEAALRRYLARRRQN